MKVEAAGASDPGRIRQNNEDAFAIVLPPRLLPGLDLLAIVADGMGGHLAGEVASRMVVDQFLAEFGRSSDRTIGAVVQSDWRREIERAVVDANAAVFQAGSIDPLQLGMGSTVVVGVIDGDRLYLGHVGDSRAYLINGSTIYQLSLDHSWVAEQVRAGMISEQDAHHHPRKNLLTRAVGNSPEVQVDIGTFELVPGDCVLLCTDGLTNLLTDDEIVRAVRDESPAAGALKLVDLANRRGAPDNVTAVIARVVG